MILTLETKQRHSKSYKKIITEPNDDCYDVEILDASPHKNMKDILFDIVRKK